MFKRFWRWYEKYYRFNVLVTAGLFLWQLIHLGWLTSEVVFPRLFGQSVEFQWSSLLLAIVDYTEIPALILVSIVLINDLQRGRAITKSYWYLALLNSQWLHLFWLTDEVVVNVLTGHQPILIPPLVAWVAIGIDYLELPVMYETIKRALKLLFGH